MTVPLIRAEIDLNAVAHNIKEFKRLATNDVVIMPAVKADGYGHGALRISETAIENGAGALGVARIEEGISLRKAGISCPILVFGYTSPLNTREVIEYALTVTVSHYETVQKISDIAAGLGKKVSVHYKIDSGMGRIGFFSEFGHPGCLGETNSGVEDLINISRLSGIELEGLYTHFSQADYKDKDYTYQQFEIFKRFMASVRQAGLDIPMCHAANSAAAIELPETHLDMIRPGISVYGLYPSGEVEKGLIDLKPAMQLKATIISLKNVPKGFKVSYGSTYVTEKETTIAAVPVGYADGFSRHFSGNGTMLVNGMRAPIVGRVCMDLTMLDVGHIPEAALDDEVVIFGHQGVETLSADELAVNAGTINYEIVSALTSRVPRVYL